MQDARMQVVDNGRAIYIFFILNRLGSFFEGAYCHVTGGWRWLAAEHLSTRLDQWLHAGIHWQDRCGGHRQLRWDVHILGTGSTWSSWIHVAASSPSTIRRQYAISFFYGTLVACVLFTVLLYVLYSIENIGVVVGMVFFQFLHQAWLFVIFLLHCWLILYIFAVFTNF